MTDEPDRNCVLFFVKYPERGKVKTRLSAELDEDITVGLYKSFVLDLLSMLGSLGSQFRICFSPEDSQDSFTGWLGEKYCYMPQRGTDLGQKMKNALIQAFDQRFDRAVIIGSDSPDLQGELIDQAFLSLKTYDAVIGPSFDGGYYLIGFNSGTFLSTAFNGIQWSTGAVFRETICKLREAGIKTYELPEWRDIDTFADLKSMFLRNRNKGFSISKTMSYIAENRQLLQQLSRP